MNYKKLTYHILALMTVSIWGATFISTKILISYGLTPVNIFIFRFLIAYLILLLFCHKRFLANSWTDEFLFFISGMCGGSLYFILENTALKLTYASNVSLLICTAPLFTMLLSNLTSNKEFSSFNIIGSCIAFTGVGLVVHHGSFACNKSSVGDILAIFAAISWTLYCFLLKVLDKRYNTMFITRKVFFYGLASAICTMIVFPDSSLQIDLLDKPVVLLNLLFLGIVASFLCYIMWNSAVKNLGADRTANYIYITPLITIITAVLILKEPFSWNIAIGSLVIIGGLWLSEYRV